MTSSQPGPRVAEHAKRFGFSLTRHRNSTASATRAEASEKSLRR